MSDHMQKAGSGVRGLTAVFFLSGFAALAYQIYFAKKLALVFGSQSSATYTVLAIYMGGMALGSALGGPAAKWAGRPIRWYAAIELLIALYCWITPWIFERVHGLYLGYAQGHRPDDVWLSVHQVWLGALVLALPTMLMGMTLPLLVQACRRSAVLHIALSRLYSSNTLGAALGALCAGYCLIPALGMQASLRLSCLIDVLVAGLALVMARREVHPDQTEHDLPEVVTETYKRRTRIIGYISLFVIGMVTMMLEVSTIHLLAVVIGNSAYAFSLMVTCFLLGLGLGGRYHLTLVGRDHARALARGSFLLCMALMISTGLWHLASDYFAWLAAIGVAENFWLRELLRAIPAIAIMLPPACAIGAMYPLTMSMAAGRRHDAIGLPSAVNTMGNIIGVLLAGFVLLPRVGGLGITWCAVALVAVVYVCAQTLFERQLGMRSLATASLVCAAWLMPHALDWSRVASGINVYMRVSYYAKGKVIDAASSADGGLTAVFAQTVAGDPRVHKTLTTNGKFEGNDVMLPGGEMEAQVGLGLVPLMHVAQMNRALVIGYGTGITAMTLHEAGFAQLDVVDLSRDLVRMSDRHFESVNLGVSRQPNVHMYFTDGRNFLSLSDEKYDLIAMQLSSIWFAGTASLYNEEFYRLAAARLSPHGVMKQWFQLHHMARSDMTTIVASARQHFRYVWIYVLGGQGLIVASNDPTATPDEARVERLRSIAASARLAPFVALFSDGLDSVVDSNVLQPQDVDRWLSSEHVLISNDDNLHLEYSTPKGNAMGAGVYDENLKYLTAWAQ